MSTRHAYSLTLEWTGSRGKGTTDYRSYGRDHVFTGPNKPPLPGSSDPQFRGDASRYNPEELLVASLSSCHMLWYLHLCADAGVVVLAYQDSAEGIMEEEADGSGHFVEVCLHPRVTLKDSAQATQAEALHDKAHALCFIARSCNFPVRHESSSN